MSEQKQIKINIADFNFNNTKKKKPKDKIPNESSIKVKASLNKPKADTLKKRSLLRMIRQQQEDRYNKLFGTSVEKPMPTMEKSVPEITVMDNELEKAKEYLNNLKEKHEQSQKMHNTTIKRHPVLQAQTNISYRVENPNNIRPNNPPIQQLNNTVPQYGCLKNGRLPTYKTFIRTAKNQPIIHIGNPITLTQPTAIPPKLSNIEVGQPQMPIVPSAPILDTTTPFKFNTPVDMVNNASIVENRLNDSLKRLATIQQSEIILNKALNLHRPKRTLQRKTVRRTYKVGRSTTIPKVTVLVSNKTIRNNTSTKTQLLKQASIQDIKKFLVKRGLIKVGCTTPNDVLRKMYESTMLICGDVQNHNPDNLLYNYMNGDNVV